MNRITLGSKVSDSITKLVGIATCESVHLNRCVQIQIDPLTVDDNGDIQRGLCVDIQRVNVLEHTSEAEGREAEDCGPEIDHNYWLGAVVQDRVSKFRGTVTVVTTRLYGIPLLTVDGEYKNGKMPSELLPVDRVEVIVPAPRLKESPRQHEGAPAGGPSRVGCSSAA